MKNNIKSSLKIAVAMLIFSGMATFTACNDNPDEYKSTDGVPTVSFVRIPDALSADSLISGAFMGKTIAIVGKNLTSIKELWFNDKKATLNTSFITDNSLIVVVPNVIPDKVTNLMYLVNSKGDTVSYPFKVDVPSPLISSMYCEYVDDGDTAIIQGNYFLGDKKTPLSVAFYGNQTAKIIEYDVNQIKVIVPNGSKAGEITVTSMYGTSRSGFQFRDKTGLITDFHNESWGNPWGKGKYSDEKGCDGKYALFKSTKASAWNWDETLMAMYWAPSANGNVPVATGDYTKLALKFEANVLSWTDLTMCIWFETYQDGINIDGTSPQYHWKPYLVDGKQTTYKTNGWKTITIPLTQFNTNKAESTTDLKIGDISKYTNIDFFMFNSLFDPNGAYPIHICIDNPRIVKL